MQMGQLTVPDGLEPAVSSCSGPSSRDTLFVTYTSLSLVSSSSSLLSTQLSDCLWLLSLRFLLGRWFSSTITTESLWVRSTTTGSEDSHVRSTTSSPALSSSSIGSPSEAISAVEAMSLLRFRACLEFTAPPRRLRWVVLMVFLDLKTTEKEEVLIPKQ